MQNNHMEAQASFSLLRHERQVNQFAFFCKKHDSKIYEALIHGNINDVRGNFLAWLDHGGFDNE